MIKLQFSNFSFGTNGFVSKGTIQATIKIRVRGKYRTISSKIFNTKITLHKDDTPDLNKAYKYIRAKLERDAYDWAGKEAQKEISNINTHYNELNAFIDKASHIISHDNKYLKTF